MNLKTLLLPFILLGSFSANATIFQYDGPPANDVDTFIPTTVDLIVTDFGIINDLNVFINIDFGGVPGNPSSDTSPDIIIRLSHAGVNNVDIAQNISFSDGGVTFDDEGVPSPTVLTPSSPLSAFDGLDVNGVWTLSITDASFFSTGANQGDDLVAWNINGDLTLPPPPPTPPGSSVPTPSILWLFGAALLGLVGVRKKILG